MMVVRNVWYTKGDTYWLAVIMLMNCDKRHARDDDNQQNLDLDRLTIVF